MLAVCRVWGSWLCFCRSNSVHSLQPAVEFVPTSLPTLTYVCLCRSSHPLPYKSTSMVEKCDGWQRVFCVLVFSSLAVRFTGMWQFISERRNHNFACCNHGRPSARHISQARSSTKFEKTRKADVANQAFLDVSQRKTCLHCTNRTSN